MKKFWCLLILPIVAFMCLTACGSDKNYKDIEDLYSQITGICVEEDNNQFFSNESKPRTLTIKYAEDVENAIANTSPVTKLQKKYVVLGYQQKILNLIYNYYENNYENFYKELSSAKFEKKDISNLYKKEESLKNCLTDFKSKYNNFCDVTADGVATIMEFDLINYSYELNKVIESSLDFMYQFAFVNEKYCAQMPNSQDITTFNAEKLQLCIDKTYLDIANIVYLNNFKAFNYSVGSRGISDMDAIIQSTNKYVIIGDLQECKSLSATILLGLDRDSDTYESVSKLIGDYLYSYEVFLQRYDNYKCIYDSEDVYTATQYKFGLVDGVDYDSYLHTLSKSSQASLVFMDDFVVETYKEVLSNLSLLIN